MAEKTEQRTRVSELRIPAKARIIPCDGYSSRRARRPVVTARPESPMCDSVVFWER